MRTFVWLMNLLKRFLNRLHCMNRLHRLHCIICIFVAAAKYLKNSLQDMVINKFSICLATPDQLSMLWTKISVKDVHSNAEVAQTFNDNQGFYKRVLFLITETLWLGCPNWCCVYHLKKKDWTVPFNTWCPSVHLPETGFP